MQEFIIIDIDAECEIESLVAFVDDLEVMELNRMKIC